MSDPRTTREALIAEVLGDLGRMIDQAKAMVPVMNEAHRALTKAHGDLLREAAEQRASFEQQIARMAETAKTHIVAHVVARTDEAYRRKVQEQELEVREAVRALLAAEVDAAMKRLSIPLRERTEHGRRVWETVLTHLAVGVAASTLMWALFPWITR